MTNPRFRPRDYTDIPAEFGKFENISWISPQTPEDGDRLWAAQMHHRFACRINKRLRERRESVAKYAELTGVGYDRTSKMLRGDVLMKFEDIAQADRILGGITNVKPKVQPASIDGDFEHFMAQPTHAAHAQGRSSHSTESTT